MSEDATLPPRNLNVPNSTGIAFDDDPAGGGRVFARLKASGVELAIWRRGLPEIVKSFVDKLERNPERLTALKKAVRGDLGFSNGELYFLDILGQPNKKYEDVIRETLADFETEVEREAYIAHHMSGIQKAIMGVVATGLRDKRLPLYSTSSKTIGILFIGDLQREIHKRGWRNAHRDPSAVTILLNDGQHGAAFPSPAIHWVNAFRACSSSIIARLPSKSQKFIYSSNKKPSHFMNWARNPFHLTAGDVAAFKGLNCAGSGGLHHANPSARSLTEAGAGRVVFVISLKPGGLKID